MSLLEILLLLSAVYSFAIGISPPFAPSARQDEQSQAHLRISVSFLLEWAIAVTGRQIRVTCYRTLGRLFTFDLAIRSNHRLIATFPYTIIRHSSYFGSLFVFLGIALCMLSPGSWIFENGWWESSWWVGGM